MIALLSPAKTLQMSGEYPSVRCSKIRFPDESSALITLLKTKSPAQIAQLMGISAKLADLNYQRFQEYQWPHPKDKVFPALYAFRGDVYQSLNADTLQLPELEYAQEHLRLLSGLYGVLRPMDQIMAYRLEMGTRLKNPGGENLYDWWGDSVTHLLNKDLKKHTDPTVINLASAEYSKVVKPENLAGEWIQVDFKEEKSGQYKIVGLFAKRARGLMARWICDHKPQNAQALQKFNESGYQYRASLSNANHYVFTRSSS